MVGRRLLQFCTLAVLLGLVAPSGPFASAQELHHAALVIDFGDGRVLVRVVSFSEETISGVDLLQRSGLDVALMGGLSGTALCAVEGVGCPPTPQDCFCQCRGGSCRYWSYFLLQGGAWVYSPTGAAGRLLGDGDMDGWVWGDGRTPPPLLDWEEIWALAPAEGPAPALPTMPAETPLPLSPRPTTLPASSPTLPQPTLRPMVSPACPGMVTLPVASASPSGLSASATASPAGPSATPAPITPLPSTASSVLSVSVSTSPTPDEETMPGYGAEGEIPYSALAFGALVVALVGLGLWVRRRR